MRQAQGLSASRRSYHCPTLPRLGGGWRAREMPGKNVFVFKSNWIPNAATGRGTLLIFIFCFARTG